MTVTHLPGSSSFIGGTLPSDLTVTRRSSFQVASRKE